MATIMKLLFGEFPATKAEKLGTFLNVSQAYMQEVTYENIKGNDREVLIDVMNFWLENGLERSWTKLAKAVEDSGNGDLAAKIRQKNCMSGECE